MACIQNVSVNPLQSFRGVPIRGLSSAHLGCCAEAADGPATAGTSKAEFMVMSEDMAATRPRSAPWGRQLRITVTYSLQPSCFAVQVQPGSNEQLHHAPSSLAQSRSSACRSGNSWNRAMLSQGARTASVWPGSPEDDVHPYCRLFRRLSDRYYGAQNRNAGARLRLQRRYAR